MNTKLFITLSIMGCLSVGMAQQQWRIDGNSNTNSSSYIGTSNNQPLIFKTNNQTRAIFGSAGSFTNTGLITTDSLSVTGGARIKGRLRIGQNSLWLGSINPFSGSDDITSTNGIINFGGELTVPLPFSQIKVGMGTQLPQFNLHIADNRSPSNRVIAGFSNFTTGQAAADGFQIGIFGNLRQGGCSRRFCKPEQNALNNFTV
ncbi:MAG: hypothetical protein ACK5QC_04270 [Bacteroidota bacterium]|nr:hypothetical protein [Bacteroidota bacterium]